MVKVKRTVEMGEELAAAGRLPAETLAEPFGVDGEQHEIAMTGEIFGESSRDLPACRQMDEAVTGIVGGALVTPASPRLLERRARADFIDRFTHETWATVARGLPGQQAIEHRVSEWVGQLAWVVSPSDCSGAWNAIRSNATLDAWSRDAWSSCSFNLP
jgi:hypothetical protein